MNANAHHFELLDYHVESLSDRETASRFAPASWREQHQLPRRSDETQTTAPRTGSAPKIRSVSIVLIMAFCQSLLFLVFWLWFCTQAGAGVTEERQPRISSYNSRSARDPFVTVATQSPPAPDALFHLQGVLLGQGSADAIVNGQTLSLGRIVNLRTEAGDIPVKPSEITRDGVLLDAGGQQIELRLAPPVSVPSSAQN